MTPRASTLQRLTRRLRGGGLRWLAGAVRDRLVPSRPACREAVLAAADAAHALEIGGPSAVFRPTGLLPVYARAAHIDNVNFATDTAWETALHDGAPFHFHPPRPPGTQFLREAAALSGFDSARYDLLLSSHCLEHLANPLGALREWRRVTRPGGHLVLILPDPARTFDHRRPVTTLAHLRDDAARDSPESDRTHFAEILALHDLSRDPDAGSPADFRARTEDNARHRCAHHHVFDLPLVAAVLAETGWTLLASESARPCHLLAFARHDAPPP